MSLYSEVLKMSLIGAVVILVVCLARLFLRKAPRIISYALWAIVLFRLLCPVSISSAFSLIPERLSSGDAVYEWSDEYIGGVDIIYEDSVYYDAAVTAGREPVYNGKNYYVITKADQLGEPATVENTWLPILTAVWLGGILVMTVYSCITYYKLRRKLVGAVVLRGNIYLSDYITSPFVIGLLRPKIYLPSGLSGNEQTYIILHEQHHIRRLDHIIKALAFLALCIHWFNPLVWLAFILSGKDMEMSCDEAVVRKMGEDIRADYSASLLSLATGRRVIAGTPLAFGEGDTKDRIKNLAGWRKPAFWVVITAVVVCVVIAVCMLTDPNGQDLNYKSLASLAYQTERLYVEHTLENAEGTVSGERVGAFLESAKWKKKNVPSALKLAADIVIKFDDDTEIRFYETEPELAMVLSSGDWRYYTMSNTSYEDVAEMLEPSEKWDLIPMVRIGGTLYLDTGYSSSTTDTTLDGEITSAVDGSERPTEDDQSNFGVGYEYRYGEREGTVELNMNGRWRIFATEEVRQEIQFPDETEIDALDDAVLSAVIEYHRPEDPDGLFHCASFVLLDKQEMCALGTEGSDGAGMNVVTVYGLALHQAYSFSEGGFTFDPTPTTFHPVAGSHIPTAITFEVRGGEYIMTDYRIPRDGTYYIQDIRDIFPDEIEEEVMDTQKYIRVQIQECYKQAIEYGSVDTENIIETLFEMIESYPNAASDSEVYVVEYRELLYYGDYTLQYIFERFLEGGETGLRGKVMKRLLDELAPESVLRLYTETGQEYFDEWFASVQQVYEENGREWMAENLPKEWMLLQMAGMN